MGLTFWLLLIWPGLIIIIFLLSKCRCCPRIANWFKNQHEHTFFNRITIFIEGSFLFLCVCFSINIHQAYKGVVKMNSSFYFAFISMVAIIIYLLILLFYMRCELKELQTKDVKKRAGAAYANLAVSKYGRAVLAFWFFSFVRRLVIAYVITFGQYSLVLQLFFVNFSTIFMMIMIGFIRPYTNETENILKLFNEFTYLLIYCHLICQTDFVQDIFGRQVMGWSLIFLIAISVLVNFGFVLVQDCKTVHRKIKLYFLKKE